MATPAPTPSATRCPVCTAPLTEVRYPGGYLNEDQWDSIRAGDWYCTCAQAFSPLGRVMRGYRYFWNREVVPPASAPAATAPLIVLDGHDWSHDNRSDVLRIGRISATRHEWIAAIEQLGPAAPSGEEAETRYVAQEDPLGCGVACLAMVSGRTYAEVRATVNPAQVEVGLVDQTILWWLNRERIWHRRSWMDGEWGYSVPSSGLALMLTHDAHWVVLEDGVVLDPARPTPLPRYDFRQAIEVLSPPRLTAQATELAALRARVEDVEALLSAFVAWDEDEDEDTPNRWDSLDTLCNSARAALAPHQTTGDER